MVRKYLFYSSIWKINKYKIIYIIITSVDSLLKQWTIFLSQLDYLIETNGGEPVTLTMLCVIVNVSDFFPMESANFIVYPYKEVGNNGFYIKFKMFKLHTYLHMFVCKNLIRIFLEIPVETQSVFTKRCVTVLEQQSSVYFMGFWVWSNVCCVDSIP